MTEPRKRTGGKTKTILLVEDEETHAELIRKSFEDSSWEIEWAASFKEAMKWLDENENKPPSLIIADYVLPDGDGLSVIEKEKVEGDLKQIEKAAIKMDHLLNDTLKLSRIGRVVNPPEDVPFGEIVQEALERTTAKIKSSGVEISLAVSDFPAVLVDRTRIVEVLVNLIENSINYMGEQSHPKIEIGYRLDECETVFFVHDNGIGIAPGQHEKVFELFYKVDRKSKGTGAGLAIVKRIIEVHGGHVWIESEKGEGCSVCFKLPGNREKKK